MTAIHTAILAMLRVATSWRLPAAVRNPRQRPLWTAFVGVAIPVTLGLPATTGRVDATSGLHNLAVLIKHLIGILACGAMVTFVADTARPDAAPVLAPYAPDEWRGRARLAAEAAAQSGEGLAVLTEALWLRAARAARLAGRAAVAMPARPDAGTFAALDFETETRGLRRLADTYHSPVAEAFARAHVGGFAAPGAPAPAGVLYPTEAR